MIPFPNLKVVAAGTLWTPAQFGASLIGFYDASDASTVNTSSSQVWTDKSASARHGTQTNSAQRPAYNATALNNKPGLIFDGIDDLLSLSSSGLPTGSAAGTLFTVAASTRTRGSALRYGTGGNFQQRDLFHDDPDNIIIATYANDVNTATTWLNTARIISAEFPAGSSPNVRTTIDGGTYSNQTTLTTLQTTSNNAAIGTGPAGYFKGIIQCGVLLDRTMTADELAKLHGWGAWTFNLVGSLPAGHPNKTAPPTI